MDKDNLNNLRHSAAHLLAAAVLELYPNTKNTIGPAIDSGFYYDFDFTDPISEDDISRIEDKMRELLPKWTEFSHREVSLDEAREIYKDNPYKLELIEEFGQEGKSLTVYSCGGFDDLCKGGHSEHPNQDIKAFKLLSLAGAYWRGSEKNKMLTRIYGTAFASQAELDQHLEMLEEAKRRDHRRIGKDQELFFIDDLVGKGLIMWLPKGTIIKDSIQNLAEEMEKNAGYQRVSTPHIAKQELFLTSGHLPYYKDGMYPEMVMDDGTYYLKAMNCPHHHQIYRFKNRSYRELPLRLAEYGMCYRNELSGTLAGLLRVRALQMNDAHIYTRKDQVKDEFKAVLNLTMEYFKIFGLEDYWFRLSKWDPNHTDKYIDQPENWEYTQGVLREVLEEMKVKFVEADDEAAFYGPKVDVQFKSVIGREETMSTIQLDFAAKERFNLSYVDDQGNENNEVFVIHRAPLSTHERFMAFLIEHYAGAFPTWLSPVQAIFVPIADRNLEHCQEMAKILMDAGIRVEVDSRSETMQSKIRDAQLQKIPYMLVVGDKEQEKGQVVAIRTRKGENKGVLPINEFLEQLKIEIESKASL